MKIRKQLISIALVVSIAVGGSQVLAQQDLLDELQQIAQDVRGLELLAPLEIEIITPEENIAREVVFFQEMATEEGADDWNILLVFLGYLEPGDDIYQILLEFMGGGTVGSYDLETKVLTVVSTSSGEWSNYDKATVIHETVHALQDQHFNIEAAYGDLDELTDDRYFAAGALIEGDAMIAEYAYVVEFDLAEALVAEVEAMEPPPLDDIPAFLLDTFYFSYDYGSEFVFLVWEQGGWAAVNEVWMDPPVSSEQILHPEKYFDREPVIAVAISNPQPLFGDEWRVIEDNAWGEFGTRLFLESSGASGRQAITASNGWGGDRVYVVTNDEESAMVWTTAWDTSDDADEFFEILLELESERLGMEPNVADEGIIHLTGEGWYAQIQRDENGVTYFLAQSEESLSLIVESQIDAVVEPAATPDVQATPVGSGGSGIAFWVRDV